MTTSTVLTIGHSNHSIERFLELLHTLAVTAITDVRSQPYSRFNPVFNREPLEEALQKNGVEYLFLGRELGARSEDPACYENGRVQYRRLAQRPAFKESLERVIELAKSHQVALMCAEKEPLACHRTLLVARELVVLGVAVAHIHADGSVESQADAMTRLLRTLGMPSIDLFRTRDELIADACARQEKRIAFVAEGTQASGQ